jgi:signal transduction histidine kinase/ligand-binding sensor domain-containing protein/DNA-binding response OmpR family regulator
MFKKLICFLIGLSLIHEADGQVLNYNFSNIDINKGLSHNQVNAILKDQTGFIWIGTLAGLNRYDGYNFKIFKHGINDTTSLSDDYIVNISEGPHQSLWISTRNGFNIYNPVTEKFSRNILPFLQKYKVPHQEELLEIKKGSQGDFWFRFRSGVYRYNEDNRNTLPLASTIVKNVTSKEKRVAAIAPFQNKLWIIYDEGSLELYHNGKLTVKQKPFTEFFRNGAEFCAAFADRKGDLYIYSITNYKGVFHYQQSTEEVVHLHTASKPKLNTNLIRGVTEDHAGVIWIATDHGGVNLYHPKNQTVNYLVHKEYDNRSIVQNSIISIYKDESGFIWLGTFKKGVSYYHPDLISFPLYTNQPFNSSSLPYDDVNTFAEDEHGNIWIGTNGGGLIYFDRKKKKFTSYKHDPSNKNSLSNNVVVSTMIDHDKKLWIGTFYGGLDCFDGENFTHYRAGPNESSISDDRIYSMLEDRDKNIWIGTLNGGLNKLDRERKTFKWYKAESGLINFDYVSSILEKRNGDLWIGTSGGIDVLRKKADGSVSNIFSASGNDKFGLSNFNINCLLEDKNGHVWVGTREGLNVYDPKVKRFLTYRVENGLPDNNIQTLKLDLKGNIWLSTSKGLCKITLHGSQPENYRPLFYSYDEFDGLQGREFNINSAFLTSKGELIFGGANGFNLFHPDAIVQQKDKFPLVFTDLQVFNKSLAVGEELDGHVVLPQSLTHLNEIVLKHNENVFSITFSALNFFNPDKVKYTYKLEGFDKEWVTAESSIRKAAYTNLDAGEYLLKVRASDHPGVFNGIEKSIRIVVLPPFWETPLAYILYALVLIGILMLIRQRGINKLKTEFAIEQERKEAQRIHELDRMKIRFFTNVSHEFRTPLSLIFAPVEKFLKTAVNEEEKQQYELIRRNARRLLNLVNQLMDFRKMEVQELKLHLSEGDIVAFIREVSLSFTDLADKKNISFTFETEIESLITCYDANKLERILFNLLSNAFKFTYHNGFVSVHLNLKENGKKKEDVLEIKVMDTGIGIPLENQPYIFDNFFQHEVPADIMNQGSGIGLSITKEFVKLHGGEISVESELENGTCFTILFPVKIISSEKGHTQPSPPVIQTQKEQVNFPSHQKPVILLVEDNDDFRFYLRENLHAHFRITEATNGNEGWQKVLSMHPHLVVSDISMPQMNGIELCKKIKNDERTRHIPVVLLTALTGEEQQLKGLEIRANDYMTKPFNFEILLSKIRNLLQEQQTYIKTYKKQVEAMPSKIEVKSLNEKLIQRALYLVEKNIKNTNFSVEELSREMNMSRVALYKKILLLTGQSPVAFIRTIRLKRSVQLMESTGLSIAEIAYEVGFNNPKYFARSFKQEYGCLPSEWIHQHRKSS